MEEILTIILAPWEALFSIKWYEVVGCALVLLTLVSLAIYGFLNLIGVL